MGGTKHMRSQGELRRAVTWYGGAEANAPHGGVFALSLPVGS